MKIFGLVILLEKEFAANVSPAKGIWLRCSLCQYDVGYSTLEPGSIESFCRLLPSLSISCAVDTVHLLTVRHRKPKGLKKSLKITKYDCFGLSK